MKIKLDENLPVDLAPSLRKRASEYAFRGSLHIAKQRTPIGPFEL